MCGVKGQGPLRSLGGSKGAILSRERMAPFPVSPTGVGENVPPLTSGQSAPTALFIFLPAAAGAGIVAADLLDLAGLLFHRAVAGGGGDDAVGHALALDLALGLDAGGEDAAHRVALNGGDHVLKHREGFLLVDVDGLVVAVGL